MSKDKITAASTLDAVAFNKISHIDSSLVYSNNNLTKGFFDHDRYTNSS